MQRPDRQLVPKLSLRHTSDTPIGHEHSLHHAPDAISGSTDVEFKEEGGKRLIKETATLAGVQLQLSAQPPFWDARLPPNPEQLSQVGAGCVGPAATACAHAQRACQYIYGVQISGRDQQRFS